MRKTGVGIAITERVERPCSPAAVTAVPLSPGAWLIRVEARAGRFE